MFFFIWLMSYVPPICKDASEYLLTIFCIDHVYQFNIPLDELARKHVETLIRKSIVKSYRFRNIQI